MSGARTCKPPGMNDRLPCGSTDPDVLDAVRRRHLAKGEQCERCDVSVDRPPEQLYRNWRTG